MFSEELLNDLKAEYENSSDAEKNSFAEVLNDVLNGMKQHMTHTPNPKPLDNIPHPKQCHSTPMTPRPAPPSPMSVAKQEPRKKENKRYGQLSDFDISTLVRDKNIIRGFHEDNLNDFSYTLTLSGEYIRWMSVQELSSEGNYNFRAKNPSLFEENGYPEVGNILDKLEYIDLEDEDTLRKDVMSVAITHPNEPGDIIILPARGSILVHTKEDITIPEGLTARVELERTYRQNGIASSSFTLEPGYRGTVPLRLLNTTDWPFVLHVNKSIASISFNRPFSMTRDEYAKRKRTS